MLDLTKIQQTLDELRYCSTILRNNESFVDLTPGAIEQLCMRSFIDITSCVRTIQALMEEKRQLEEKYADVPPAQEL